MRVLVAGSEGHLMQATIKYLLKGSHSVRGVDNFSRHGRTERPRDYEFVKGDLTYPDFVNEVMQKMDFIIQSAGAAYGVIGLNQHPADVLSNDMVLHANILRVAARHSVKKISYVSSSMIYGGCQKVPIAEEDLGEMTPRTALGLSKLVGERLCQAYFQQYGLKYTIWRPFSIIAPRERAEAVTGIAHVFADLINKIIIEKQDPVEILGDGQQVRCFIWVDDIAAAIAKFTFEEVTDCREYNMGNPEPVTILELARKIHEKGVALGVRDPTRPLRFVHHESPRGDVRILIPSIERAKNELGWQPEVSLDQALDVCIREALADINTT